MPVAPSVVPFEGTVVTRDGFVSPSRHRALRIEEIPGLVEEFRSAALNAKAAGFDGVEIHGAIGYILDQFLQDGTNKRTDSYGGPIENRARLLFEVVDVTTEVGGKGRVGVRLSPNSTYNSMFDSNPVAERLNRYALAYLHVIEPRVKGIETISEGQPPIASALLRNTYQGNILAAGGFDPKSAEATIEKGDADMVAFGRYFISNPDLARRIQLGLPLNNYDRDTFYNNDGWGYTDYPFYDH